jgi:hypothetical protein
MHGKALSPWCCAVLFRQLKAMQILRVHHKSPAGRYLAGSSSILASFNCGSLRLVIWSKHIYLLANSADLFLVCLLNWYWNCKREKHRLVLLLLFFIVCFLSSVYFWTFILESISVLKYLIMLSVQNLGPFKSWRKTETPIQTWFWFL